MGRWFSWFENFHFHVKELWGLKAVIEFYYGLELDAYTSFRLTVPLA